MWSQRYCHDIVRNNIHISFNEDYKLPRIYTVRLSTAIVPCSLMLELSGRKTCSVQFSPSKVFFDLSQLQHCLYFWTR